MIKQVGTLKRCFNFSQNVNRESQHLNIFEGATFLNLRTTNIEDLDNLDTRDQEGTNDEMGVNFCDSSDLSLNLLGHQDRRE